MWRSHRAPRPGLADPPAQLSGDRLGPVQSAPVDQIDAGVPAVGPADQGIDQVVDGPRLGGIGGELHVRPSGHDATRLGEVVLDPEAPGVPLATARQAASRPQAT